MITINETHTHVEIECENCESENTIANNPNGVFSGLYDCLDCDFVGECPHNSTHREVVIGDTMRNGEHEEIESVVDVCDSCEMTVEV